MSSITIGQSLKQIPGNFKRHWKAERKGNKVLRTSLKLLNATVPVAKKAAPVTKPLASSLKVVGFINIPVNMMKLWDSVKGFFGAVRAKDREDAVVQAGGCYLSVTDSVKSGVSGAQGVLHLARIAAPAVMTPLGVGLGFAMAPGIPLGVYDGHKTRMLLNQVPKQPEYEDLKDFLEKFLGTKDPGDVDKQLKKDIWRLKKCCGKKVFGQLKGLFEHVRNNPDQSAPSEDAQKVIKHVREMLKRHTVIKGINTATDVLNLVAACFALTPLAPVISLALLALSALVKLVIFIYERGFINHGIEDVAFDTNNPTRLE